MRKDRVLVCVLVALLGVPPAAFSGEFINPNPVLRGFLLFAPDAQHFPAASNVVSANVSAVAAPVRCDGCTWSLGVASDTRWAPPMQLAKLDRIPPIVLLPQAVQPSGAAAAATQARNGYWTKRRAALVGIGLGLAGAGAAMWVTGKDIANPSYSDANCRSALTSGSYAAIGAGCNETVPDTRKKAGLVLMIAGGPFSLLGFFLPGR